MGDDHILMPLNKKQAWEMKEKYTSNEIKLQYAVFKLED